MSSSNMNMEDPAKQEAIRRGHHDYVPTVGKHGSYVPKQYRHQEYPKMMGRWPKPEYRHFTKQNGVEIPGDLALQRFQAAQAEWDQAMSASTVNSKAEEAAWLKENAS